MTFRDDTPAGCLDHETVAALFLGSLAGERREHVERHLAGCGWCRRVVAELARTSWGERTGGVSGAGADVPARGTTVGRYLVLDCIGQGGMGIVHAAYDPELDRKVALKLVRAEVALRADAQARLQREAKAMARLAHPNVVHVYDIGVWGERLFMAMELVDGVSLRAWLAEARPWPEVLAVLTAAGAGLAAAHAAGLVHGDFKPDNVLYAGDGRVCVTDFGLALGVEGPGADRLASVVEHDQASWSRSVGGTPAYMAPELWRGQGGDAASDQFAFCVTLYEALFGVRPFAGESLAELAQRIAAGVRQSGARERRVPAAVRAALLRGLDPDPQARFPSMAALLAALGRHRQRRRRQRVALAALGVAAALAAAGVTARQRARTTCRGAAEMAAMAFNSGDEMAIERALRATGAPYADTTWASVRRRIHDYLGRWAAMRTEACEATRVRAEQSEELLELRMQCLDHDLVEVRALVGVLAHADGGVAVRAVQAVEGLPTLAACADAAALRGMPRPPAGAKAALDRLKGDIANAFSLRRAGHLTEARAAMTPTVPSARALGFAPLEAEALVVEAEIAAHQGRHLAAKRDLLDALAEAERSRADALTARAANLMAAVVGEQDMRLDEAIEWSRLAEAALERVPEEARLRVQVLRVRSECLLENDHSAEGLVMIDRALELAARVLPADSPDFATLLNAKGRALYQAHHPAEALALLEQARDIRARVFGASHPDLSEIWGNMGDALEWQDRFDDALAAYRQAFEVIERAGEKDSNLAVLGRVAQMLIALERYDEAEQVIRRLLADSERLPEYYEARREAWGASSHLARERGHYAEALASLARSTAIFRRVLGGNDHVELVDDLTLEGEIHLDAGHPAAARRAFERAVGLYERLHGTDAAAQLNALVGLGRVRLALDDAGAALAPLEHAVALTAQSLAVPTDEARARFELARALGATGGDRVRARRLAEEARALYRKVLTLSASRHAAKPLAEVEAWLAAH